jgi:uncharacterized delta-60 repeat protein
VAAAAAAFCLLLLLPGAAGALAPGDLDPGFASGGVLLSQFGGGANPSSLTNSALALADGRILLGGAATDSSGKEQALLVRLTPGGAPDASFGTNGIEIHAVGAGATPSSNIHALALQPDGKIIAVGDASDASGHLQLMVMRLNPNGGLDSSFGTGGVMLDQLGTGGSPSTRVFGVAVQPDGKIVVGGTVSRGDPELFVARLQPNGGYDSSFATGGKLVTQLGAGTPTESFVNAIALQPDGKVVAAGYATDSNGTREFMVVRLNAADGSFDSSFGTDGKVFKQLGSGSPTAASVIQAIALQADGKIVVGGGAVDGSGLESAVVARLNGSDGSFDSSFGTGGVSATSGPGAMESAETVSLAVQPNGKIVAGNSAENFVQFQVMRLTPGGALDPSFGGGSGKVTRQFGTGTTAFTDMNRSMLTLTPDGGIIAGGDASAGSDEDLLAARLVGDLPPAAAFSVRTTRPLAGAPVVFDGGASGDPDGTLTNYQWNFGDGTTGAGSIPFHVYSKPGVYSVTLTVTDDDLLSASRSGSLVVAARPRISHLRISPRSFRAAPRGGSIAARGRRTGTTVRYSDAQASTTTFTVLKSARGVRRGRRCVKPRRGGRHGKRCTRLVSLGSFRHHDVAGANHFRFTGRVRRHRLAPGRYTLRAVPRFGGVGGRAAITHFRIVR